MFPHKIICEKPSKTLLSLFYYAKNLSLVQQIHAQIIVNGLHKDALYGSNIVNAYIGSGSLPLASKAFLQITAKNLYSWNSIISGHLKFRFYDDVLHLFSRMRSEGNGVDTFNLGFAIKASTRLLLLQNGKSFHCLSIKSGLEEDLFIAPALLELYADLGSLNDAQKLFERFSYRSSVLWCLMMKACLKSSQEPKVFELFSNMTNHFGFQPDAFAMVGLVRAYANVLARREGKAAHGLCIKNNLLVNVCLLTSVVYMYMKCGFLHYAARVFEEANYKDVVLWTTVVDGYAQKGRFVEAMSLFRKMLGNSVTPNPVTLVSILLACSGVGSLRRGKSVHGFVIRNQVDLDVVINTSLIDMYAKCGCVKTAYRIFSEVPEKNVVCWTAMINGLGMHGLYLDALATFDKMVTEKNFPNSVTFASVLSACSHSGEVEKGWRIFNSMKNYAISPAEEHYTCMIDLLVNAGQIESALSFICTSPIKPSARAWEALLSACRKHKRVELAEELPNCLWILEPSNSSLHVSLSDSSVYSDASIWELVESTLMKNIGVAEPIYKGRDFASIEINNWISVFCSDDIPACKSAEIDHIQNSLSREMREMICLL